MSIYMEEVDNGGLLDQGFEIQALIDREKSAAAGNEFDLLHDKVKTDKKTEELEKETKRLENTSGDDTGAAADDSSDKTGDEGGQDAASDEDEDVQNPFDADPEETKAEAPEGQKTETDPPAEKEPGKDNGEEDLPVDDKKEVKVSESLRDVYEMGYSRVVLEEITREDLKDAAVWTGGAIVSAAKTAGLMVYEFAKVLVILGVRYGPGVARNLRKGVMYLFTRSAKTLFKTTAVVSDYIRRHYNSVSSIQKDIQGIRKASESLGVTEGVDISGESFTEEKVIPWFAHGRSIGLSSSAAELIRFLDATVDPMAGRVIADIHSVKKLIDMTAVGGVNSGLFQMMNVNPIGGEYDRKRLKDYPMENQDVETYVYNRPLPNAVTFVTNLPRKDLEDIDRLSKAYADSSIFMGVDASYQEYPRAIPLLNKSDLDKYIGQLETLAGLLQEHTRHYVQIANESKGLKLGYRHYYQKLSASPEKVSLHDSLSEFVFLKQSFASRTYLAGMMDIHDYVSAYLVRATRFAKKNLKVLASAKPSENPPE